MSRKSNPERTALVIVLGDQDHLDDHFEALTSFERTLEQTPRRAQGADVLLGSFGAPGERLLCLFVGVLVGCEFKENKVIFTGVERFPTPVIALRRGHFRRDDLLGDLKDWWPTLSYVLPAALEQVRKEAEA
jgi:hypothetical protein